MPEATYSVGDTFRVQFVWKTPVGDFLRAIFEVEVLHLDPVSDKYVIRLKKFLAGRQENDRGVMQPKSQMSIAYWSLVGDLIGQKISLAFEADDGRPLWLRLETLTGEHDFFRRLNELPAKLRSWDGEMGNGIANS